MMQAQNAEIAETEFTCLARSSYEWKAVTAALQSIAEDVSFEVDANGVRSRAMDPSHVALLEISISSKAFEKFVMSRPTRFTTHSGFLKNCKARRLKGIYRNFPNEHNGALAMKIGNRHYRKEFDYRICLRLI